MRCSTCGREGCLRTSTEAVYAAHLRDLAARYPGQRCLVDIKAYEPYVRAAAECSNAARLARPVEPAAGTPTEPVRTGHAINCLSCGRRHPEWFEWRDVRRRWHQVSP